MLLRNFVLAAVETIFTQLLMLQIFVTTIQKTCNCQPLPYQQSDECQYSGDMGRIHPECIRIMRHRRVFVRECHGIYYGPGLLYTNREDTEFWVTINALDRQDFEDDLTYTIYSKTGDFDTEGSLTWVENCKSMNLDSRCILPKRREGEKHVMYFPVKTEKYREVHFCEFEIEEHEYQPRPHFCRNEQEYECLIVEDGEVRMKTLFIPLTNSSTESEYKFCTFSVPDRYLEDYDREEVIYRTPKIKKVGKTQVVMKQEPATPIHICKTMTNKPSGNIFDRAATVLGIDTSNDDGICFFLQMPDRNKRWTRMPVCRRRNRSL